MNQFTKFMEIVLLQSVYVFTKYLLSLLYKTWMQILYSVCFYMCTCYNVVFCNHPTVPGVPYFVEVRVMESVRGLGLPRASSVFFSQETGQELSVMLCTQPSPLSLQYHVILPHRC